MVRTLCRTAEHRRLSTRGASKVRFARLRFKKLRATNRSLAVYEGHGVNLGSRTEQSLNLLLVVLFRRLDSRELTEQVAQASLMERRIA